jgi:AcrR family transcriptional regulator
METLLETIPRPSRDSAGKLRRQRAIIEAAHKIISGEGDAGLTMRRLAVEARVSLMTPYNLFGSKEAVIRAVFDEDFEINLLKKFQAKAGDHPLGRLFAVIDISFDAFKKRPAFYKALFRTLQGAREAEGRRTAWLRAAFISSLVDDAMASGYLDATHRRVLAVTVSRIFGSAVLHWIDGDLGIDTARRDVGLGVALFLAASVPRAYQTDLARLRDRYIAAN